MLGVLRAVEDQKMGREWVEKCELCSGEDGSACETFRQARLYLMNIAWNSRAELSGATNTLDLLRVLGDRMVTTVTVDIMAIGLRHTWRFKRHTKYTY